MCLVKAGQGISVKQTKKLKDGQPFNEYTISMDSGTLNRITAVENNLKIVDDHARAGIAGAHAAGNLAQPMRAGASVFGVAVGGYRQQGALAVGLSTVSDNGKWILKGSMSLDTQRHVGGGASINYQW